MSAARKALSTIALAAAGLIAGAARADESPRRPVPDYDGRPPEASSAGEVAKIAPRAALAPLYVVSEYLLRRPLGWLVVHAEKNQWPTRILEFFTFDPNHKIGLVPTALVDFGFKPSVGFYFFWDDFVAQGNDFRVHASTWGEDWLFGSVTDRVWLGGRAKETPLTLQASALRRPDLIYHGTGPRTLESARTRYESDRLEALAQIETPLSATSFARATAGARRVRFRPGSCCDGPELADAIASGLVNQPPGFPDGYDVAFQRLELALDTRGKRVGEVAGARVEGSIENGVEMGGDRRWVRYGGSAGGFVDVSSGSGRIVSMWVTALFADPWRASSGPVPFTEQVRLGGNNPMRGYLDGRLVDRSALIATLSYEWPIWVVLDGTVQVSTGNVAGPHLEGFEAKDLRVSAVTGVRSVGSTDHFFELLAGVGTETFADGLRVTSVRLVFGGNRGF